MMLLEGAWELTEVEHDPRTAGLAETLFCLANGKLGLRQTIDPENPDGMPGAFLESVYDRALAVRTAIVNVPVPVPVGVRLADEPGAIGRATRRLDLRAGVLTGDLVVEDDSGPRVRLRWSTIVHLEHPDLILTWGTVAALGSPAAVRLTHGLDWRHGNSYMGGHSPEIVTHHVVAEDVGALADGGLRLSGTTVGLGARVEGAVRMSLESGLVAGEHLRERRRLLESVALDLAPGHERRFRQVCVLAGAAPGAARPDDAAGRLERFEAMEVQTLVAAQRRAWTAYWDDVDVEVVGDPQAQATLRFGAFHLRQNVDAIGDGPVHIPARGLTSEYHSGHSFFNTEFFKLPYWIHADPAVARRLLLFRHRGLDAARRHAADLGRAGARYPEEADRDGEPAAPWQIWDIRTGEVSYEWSGREKHFLSAAVAWGVCKYHEATGDDGFLADHGLEMAVGAAQYAESATVWDDDLGAYRVLSVMGGDEYHYHVDDNHLTNHLLAWSMRYAADTVEALIPSHPDVVERLCGPEPLQSARRWRDRAARMRYPVAGPGGVIQQHEGYFDLPDQIVTAVGANGRPAMSDADREAADRLEVVPTQLIKEADVVLLLALFPEAFDEAACRASYAYYLPRTVHESSLSAAPYGLVAARLGDLETAHRCFLLSGRYDLDFHPREGYRNGLHLAGYAGAWQIAVQGFGGFAVRDGRPCLDPRLPDGWERLSFGLTWRGRRVRVRIDRESTEVWLTGPDDGASQEWSVNSEPRLVRPGPRS